MLNAAYYYEDASKDAEHPEFRSVLPVSYRPSRRAAANAAFFFFRFCSMKLAKWFEEGTNFLPKNLQTAIGFYRVAALSAKTEAEAVAALVRLGFKANDIGTQPRFPAQSLRQ